MLLDILEGISFMKHSSIDHDDVIKWKTFPRNWPFVRGIHRSLVNSPHKGQWRGALMFSLICARINAWVTNRKAGDLTCHHAHYDVILMISSVRISEMPQNRHNNNALAIEFCFFKPHELVNYGFYSNIDFNHWNIFQYDSLLQYKKSSPISCILWTLMFEQELSTPNIARGQKTDNLELFHSLNWASIKPVLSNKAENTNWLKSP